MSSSLIHVHVTFITEQTLHVHVHVNPLVMPNTLWRYPPRVAADFSLKLHRFSPILSLTLIMSRARRPPAVAPSHFKSPTAALRRPCRSYPSYHVLWPPAIVQIFFRKSILASCGGCPRRNGMHVTPEDFTSRGACLCMRLLAFIRMPIESASLNTRSTSFRDLTSAPIVQAAMGWQVGAEPDADSGRCRCGRR